MAEREIDGTNGIGKSAEEMTTVYQNDMPKEYDFSKEDMATESEVMDMTEPAIENFPTADSRGGDMKMQGTSLVLSEGLTEALTGAGWTPKDSVGECWEFVTREENWEESLLRVLRAAVSFEWGLPESGTYRYVLDGRYGKYTIVSPEPLDAIVRLETEQGIIWGLLGERAFFYTE